MQTDLPIYVIPGRPGEDAVDEPEPVVILITFPIDGDATAFATALVR